MFGLFKRKITAKEFGVQNASWLKDKHWAGYPESEFLPLDADIGAEMVKTEWLYFRAFTFDYAVFMALGASKEKDAVLTAFWSEMRIWLEAIPVRALPERLLIVGGPKPIPAEETETSYERLRRRSKDYARAVSTPHQNGENWAVAGTFAGFCGTMDSIVILGVSTFFSHEKVGIFKLTKSLRIVV